MIVRVATSVQRDEGEKNMTGQSKVYAVDEVRVTISKTTPAVLVVCADGRTTSAGWTDGNLSPYVYLRPPDDGVQEFDFLATPPASPSADVLTPVNAYTELSDIDVETYWGPEQPLKGIRVHAVSNAKTVVIMSATEKTKAPPQMTFATADYTAPNAASGTPGFEQDIKPLFRVRDVNIMEMIAGFNLHKFEDVKANAEAIFKKLNDDMPCDGLWPAEDIKKFEDWKNGGMPA